MTEQANIIISREKDNNLEKLTVPIKAQFEHMDYTFIVHRPFQFLEAETEKGKRKYSYWRVSEKSTGCSIGIVDGYTIQNAITEGKERLDQIGKERLAEAVNHALEKYGRINTEEQT